MRNDFRLLPFVVMNLNIFLSMKEILKRNPVGRLRPFRSQRGISLFIVLVVLLLTLIVVLGGLIIANLNEGIVGNQSDAQRVSGAAEALLDAAQRDIRLNGRHCNADALGRTGTNPTVMVMAVTGERSAPCTLRYPRNLADYVQMRTGNLMGDSASGDQCAPQGSIYQGICIASSPASARFAIAAAVDDGPTSAEQWSTGVTYNNKFISDLNTGADYGDSAVAGGDASAAVSLALGGTDGDPKGKYWVEIYPYNVMAMALSGVPANVSVPEGTYPFVFRITAMAKGLRGGTTSVLRIYYVPYPMMAAS